MGAIAAQLYRTASAGRHRGMNRRPDLASAAFRGELGTKQYSRAERDEGSQVADGFDSGRRKMLGELLRLR